MIDGARNRVFYSLAGVAASLAVPMTLQAHSPGAMLMALGMSAALAAAVSAFWKSSLIRQSGKTVRPGTLAAAAATEWLVWSVSGVAWFWLIEDVNALFHLAFFTTGATAQLLINSVVRRLHSEELSFPGLLGYSLMFPVVAAVLQFVLGAPFYVLFGG